MLLTETLPIVGEGITGPPVIGPVDCADGGAGNKVGTATAAGPAYIVNPDGTSCYGDTSGKANALSSDFSHTATATDSPVIPTLGNPAFGAAGGSSADQPAFITAAIGLFRALDLQVTEYQGGQDLIGVWDAASGQFQSGFPGTVNDLQLLTGPAVADIDGNAGEEVLTGSASQDLVAYGPDGAPPNSRWPKLTTDWTVATPLIGSFGTDDTAAAAHQGGRRHHQVRLRPRLPDRCPACSPSSSPRFHHDNANSGDYSRDAILPGAPTGIGTAKHGTRVRFDAPGDDLLCGTADHYELVTAGSPIDESSFAGAKPLAGAPEPAEAGDDAELRRAEGLEGLPGDPRGRRAGQRRPGRLGQGQGPRIGLEELRQPDQRHEQRRPPARHPRR